ncbi:MAG: TlpA family protein disulfide reductase, partial [Myxococcota bacterium]|nr:TlpA family protein disulfide reductase [Myxococcota bacterium]
MTGHRLATGFRASLLASAAAVVACGHSLAGNSPGDRGAARGTGTVAPDFTASDLAGKTFRLGDHVGKEIVLLDFWSTFCEPCKAEFPHLRALYADKKASGLLVVGVAMDGPETVADVPAFARRFDLSFPIVTDEDSRIANLYNPKKSMPFSVLINRGGH